MADLNVSATTSLQAHAYSNVPKQFSVSALTSFVSTATSMRVRTLGRYQTGDVVRLEVFPIDGTGLAVTPDSAPVATITASSVTYFTGKLPMLKVPTAFSLPLFVSPSFPLATLLVTYAWSVGGTPFTAADAFDVIAGGDPGGSVISMTAYDRPEAQYFVVQLSSGRIAQGRNPRI